MKGGGERYDVAPLWINKRIEQQLSGGARGSSGPLDSFTLIEPPQRTSSLNPNQGFQMVIYRVNLSPLLKRKLGVEYWLMLLYENLMLLRSCGPLV